MSAKKNSDAHKNAKTPAFLGDSQLCIPLPGSTMQKNYYGIDVLNRQFSCPRSEVGNSIPPKASSDFFYPNLCATGNYSVNEGEGLMTTISVEYKGLLNNFIPDPLITYGMGTGQTSATNGDTGDAETQRTWEIVFYSPTATYRYITNGKPIGPKFSTYAGGAVASPTIQTQSITDGTGRRRISAPTIALQVIGQLAGFNASPVAGTPYYECDETWRGVYILVPSGA